MSLQSKFGQLRSRVGEFKDKLSERQKRTPYLDEQEQELEHEVLSMRDGFNVMLTREQEFLPSDERKIPLYNLGTKMMRAGKDMGDTTPFGAFYTKVGRLQLDLGQLQAMHNKQLHSSVHDPARGVIQEEYKKLMQLRKKLQANHAEAEAASTKFTQACAKVHKQGYSGSASKVDTLKTELEDAQAALNSTKTQYMEELLDLASKEKGFMASLETMVEEQLRFHESACELLRAALPSLRGLKDSAIPRKAFGRGLPEEGVDPVLGQLAAVINRDGLEVQGLFRRAGSSVAIRQLKTDINSGRADFRAPSASERDVHAVANAFKMYLREMPDCLLTTEMYSAWMAAARMPDHNERLYAFKDLLERLPRPHFVSLRFLSRFLYHVSLHSEHTKMEASNLGIVIGPNIGWPPDRATNAMYSATDSGPLSSMCEAFITYHEWLFPQEEGELPGDITDPYAVPNAPPPPSTSKRSSSLLLHNSSRATESAATASASSSTSNAPPLPSANLKPSLVTDKADAGAASDVFGGDTDDDDGDSHEEEENWDDDEDDDDDGGGGGDGTENEAATRTKATAADTSTATAQLGTGAAGGGTSEQQTKAETKRPPLPQKPPRPRPPPARPPKPAPPNRPKPPVLPPKPGKS